MTTLETCGRYELIQRIAVGGMAEIYLARETGLAGFERLVIVKRILPNLAADTDFIDMFLDEARLAARLTHPNIVHIYELDEQEGTYFIAMEYVPGGDLHEMLGRRRGEMLPLGDAIHIVSEVCAGLQFAHALAGPDGNPLGVVHRDVTPKNVLLSVDGVVKVMDFGIAKARAKLSVTRPGDIKGTFSYMAPEQARGERVNRRADIYAVGALLYRLTTGSPAYPQLGNALLAAVRSGQFVRPRKVNPELPPVVEEIILRAMALEPKDRHTTCGAMRRELGDAARSLGLHADSETLAAHVRAAFPRVPGATVPVDAPMYEPPGEPPTNVETPVRQALAPAGPDESTGLMAMDDVDILEAHPIGAEEPATLGHVVSPFDDDDEDLGLEATDMVLAPPADAPTRVADLPRSSPAPPKQSLADLVAPRTDPASRLPSLVDGEGDEDQPTNVREEGGEDDPTRALLTPESMVSPGAAALGAAASAPPPHVSPIPPPPPEPVVTIGPRTPTATPIVRSARRQQKARSRRGTLLIGLAFFVGAVMIAAAVTLVVMPGPASPPVASAEPGEPEPTTALPPDGLDPASAAALATSLPRFDGGIDSPPSSPTGPTADGGGSSSSSPGVPPPGEASGPDEGTGRAELPEVEPIRLTSPGSPPRLEGSSAGRPGSPAVAKGASGGGPSGGEKRAPTSPAKGTKVHTGGEAVGYLTVWTTPYSKVYLGGRFLGTTPMSKREVPVGRHRLKLVNPEVPQKVVSITVHPGKVTRVRERL